MVSHLTMEAQTLESPSTNATVDGTRPFRSVKEAVAIFGDRLFTREIQKTPKTPSLSLEKGKPREIQSFGKSQSYSSEEEVSNADGHTNTASHNKLLVCAKNEVSSPSSPIKPSNSARRQVSFSLINESVQSEPSEHTPSPTKQVAETFVNYPTPTVQKSETETNGNVVHKNDLVMMLMVLKKLESDLQETKMELKQLKERGSENEIALASLNAELHKNMSKIAKAEAAEAAKAASKSTPSREKEAREAEMRGEDRSRGDMIMRAVDSPTLAQILSISDYESYFKDIKKVRNKAMKKKPIVPLVTDMFLWKKRSPTNNLSSPMCPTHTHFT